MNRLSQLPAVAFAALALSLVPACATRAIGAFPPESAFAVFDGGAETFRFEYPKGGAAAKLVRGPITIRLTELKGARIRVTYVDGAVFLAVAGEPDSDSFLVLVYDDAVQFYADGAVQTEEGLTAKTFRLTEAGWASAP